MPAAPRHHHREPQPNPDDDRDPPSGHRRTRRHPANPARRRDGRGAVQDSHPPHPAGGPGAAVQGAAHTGVSKLRHRTGFEFDFTRFPENFCTFQNSSGGVLGPGCPVVTGGRITFPTFPQCVILVNSKLTHYRNIPIIDLSFLLLPRPAKVRRGDQQRVPAAGVRQGLHIRIPTVHHPVRSVS